MIDRQRTPGELREEFSVLGSTGNVGDFDSVSLNLMLCHNRSGIHGDNRSPAKL